MDDFTLSIEKKLAVIHKKSRPELNPQIAVSLLDNLCISAIFKQSCQSGECNVRITAESEWCYTVPLICNLTRNTVRRRWAGHKQTTLYTEVVWPVTGTGSQQRR